MEKERREGGDVVGRIVVNRKGIDLNGICIV
jgi:hypothetical protein